MVTGFLSLSLCSIYIQIGQRSAYYRTAVHVSEQQGKGRFHGILSWNWNGHFNGIVSWN
jgi:hypothetical protein